MQSDSGKVTPLSQAHFKRQSGSNGGIEVSEDRLREILAEVIDERITSKISRLEKSINLMAGKFEAILNGEAEDAALRMTTDLEAADLALGGIQLPTEEYYIYTCSQLAEKLNVRSHDILQMIKTFGLRGNPTFHKEISTGKTSKINKWSDKTFQRLSHAIESGEYKILSRAS